MISFPENIIGTPWDGYFYDNVKHILYSIKVGGVLRPMKKQKPNYFNRYRCGYRISINGRSRFIPIWYLDKLKPKQMTIPIYEPKHT